MLGSAVIVLLCVVETSVALTDSSLDLHWQLWKKTHSKAYNIEVSCLDPPRSLAMKRRHRNLDLNFVLIRI